MDAMSAKTAAITSHTAALVNKTNNGTRHEASANAAGMAGRTSRCDEGDAFIGLNKSRGWFGCWLPPHPKGEGGSEQAPRKCRVRLKLPACPLAVPSPHGSGSG